MILVLVELALFLVVAVGGWVGAQRAIDGTLAAAGARGSAGDLGLVHAAGNSAGAWFAAGVLLLAVARGFTALRRGQHIRTPFLLPAATAAAGLGLAVQLGYGSPFREAWPGPPFAQGVFAACLFASLILVVPGDIGSWISRGRVFVGGGSIALLAILTVFGDAPGNSGQRINLFGAQPIELVKVGAVLFAADALGRRAAKLRYQRVRAGLLRLPRATLLLPALGALLATWGGLFLVKDLGPTLILGGVFLGLFYVVTRSPGWVLLALGTLGALLAVFGLDPSLAPSSTVQTRLSMWTEPWLNGLPNGDQLALGFWAMAAGGWSGSGLGTAFPGGIPAGHTDLVYAHTVEELGALGACTWLALLGVAVTDGLRVASRNRTPERAMMAAGLGMLLVAQTATILGGTFGFIPLTGVVVPFVSFGKTSMVVFFGVIALIARLGEDGEARVATDELREIAGGVRHVQIGVAVGVAVAALATVRFAVIGRDQTSLRPVVTTLKDGTPALLSDRRLSSIAARIRRGSVVDRSGLPLAQSPTPGTREHPLGDALGTVLGPVGDGLLRARWSIERTQEPTLRGYPDRTDGPAVWLGRVAAWTGDPAGRESLLLAVPSAATVDPGEEARARAVWDRKVAARLPFPAHPEGTAPPIRRVTLAAPDLSSLLPLARLPLAERGPAIQALSDAVDARSVTLTVDARLQAAVAAHVQRAAAKSAVGAAALVVLHPATGQILARAQWPDYDPGADDWRPKRVAEDPKFMGIYGAWSDKTGAHGVYQAGSSFKILTALAALRTGMSSPSIEPHSACPSAADPRFPCDQVHDGRPSFTLPEWSKPIHDHGDGGARGTLDLVRAITESSNIYFGQLALALGPQAYRALRADGVEFGNPGLDAEPDGDFTGLGASGSRRLAQTGFGQGAGSWNVTQAARLLGAVARADGAYVRCPPDMRLDAACASTPLLPPGTSVEAILAGMAGVMKTGTGARLPAIPGVRVYGKTGTADAPGTRDEAPWKIKPAQTTLPHSWFVAIAEPSAAPSCDASTADRYVVAGVVPHGGFGASAAAPMVMAAIKDLKALEYLPSGALSASVP